MADLAELTIATACASGEWNRRGSNSKWLAWAKDPSPGKRNVFYWKHGGAETNWEDIEIPALDAMLMIVNELNGVVISFDTSPGYFRNANGEGRNARDVYQTAHENMAAIGHFRTVLGDPNNVILPSGIYISRDPDESGMGGSSSGGYDALRTQLAPSGSSRYTRGLASSAEHRFVREYGHECNIIFANIAQTTLSQFHEYIVDPAVPDDEGGSYVTSSTVSAGATSIPISGDTFQLYRANRVVVNVGGTDYTYAVTADSGATPSSISITPQVQVQIPSGTAVVLQRYGVEQYGTKSWAHQYFFPCNSGYVWRSDDSAGDGFPLDLKRRADVDYMLDVTNPRVHEISLFASGATGDTMAKLITTGDYSFLVLYTKGAINPCYINLHDEMQVAWLCHWLYYTAGNTNVEAYLGNATSNPSPNDPLALWNKGRNAGYSAAAFKAFLQSRGW